MSIKSWRRFGLFFALSLILPVVWYSYVYSLSKNSIDVFGVFGGHDKYQTIQMLSSKEWHIEMFRRILALLSGMPGFLLLLAGISIAIFLKKGRLFLFYGFSFVAFVTIVAEGNLDASYRQFCGIPVMSAFFGLGLTYLAAIILTFIKSYSRKSVNPFIIVAVFLILTTSFIVIKNRNFLGGRDKFYPMSMKEWMLSKEINNHSEEGSKIITAGTYSIHKGGNDLSPVLYYYSERQGWTLGIDQLSLAQVEILRNKGAVLFAMENIRRERELESFAGLMKETYPVIFQDSQSDLLLLDIRAQ